MTTTANYLERMLGTIEIQDNGVAIVPRTSLNVVGATFSDDGTTATMTLASASTPAAVAIAALAIDWTLGNVFTKTLAAGASTITFTGAASGKVIIVRLTGATSTVTWPTVRWPGGTAPTQTSVGTDVYTFVHDGANIYGSVVQAMA